MTKIKTKVLAAITALSVTLSLSATGANAASKLPESGIAIVLNPYAGVDWDNWEQYKAALHAHTNNSYDVKRNDAIYDVYAPEDAIRRHYELGFNILAITDHSVTTADGLSLIGAEAYSRITAEVGRDGAGMIFVPGTNEHSDAYLPGTFPSTGSRNHHVNTYWSNQFSQNNDNNAPHFENFLYSSSRSEHVDALARRILTQGNDGVMILNHLARNLRARPFDEGLTVAQAMERANDPAFYTAYANLLAANPNILGLEVFNEFDNETQGISMLWDNILTQTMPERPVWGTATDDSHSETAVGFGYTLHLMPELNIGEFRASLENGAFFAFSRVDRREGVFPLNTAGTRTNPANAGEPIKAAWGLTSSERQALLDLPTPEISRIDVAGNTITVAADNYEFIKWYSGGELVSVGETIDLDRIAGSLGNYVRAVVGHSEYGVLYTQPFGLFNKSAGEPGEPEYVESRVIYDLQNDTAMLSDIRRNTTYSFIRTSSGSDTVFTANRNANPKTVTVTKRGGTSQGLRVIAKSIADRGSAGNLYRIDYTGYFPNDPNATARIRDEGTSTALATADAVNGAFSVSATLTYSQIVKDAAADVMYSLGNTSGNIDIVYTGVVITELAPVTTTEKPPVTEGFNPITARELVADIGAGWNLGNSLDARYTKDGVYYPNTSLAQFETNWDNPVTTPEVIRGVKAAGFDTLRIPVSWHKAADPNNNWRIRADWMARVKEIVDWAVAEDMYVILNTHHDSAIFPVTAAERTRSQAALAAIWGQIAVTFRDYSEKLIFEGLNEPIGLKSNGTDKDWSGTSEYYVSVNQLNQTFVETVRASGGNNYYRILMVPTYAANGDSGALNAFTRPFDPAGADRLVLSVHKYEPVEFTLSAKSNSWSRSGVTSALQRIANRANALNMPVILGEWGVTNQDNEQQRAEYAEYYVRTATDFGLATVLWDNGVVDYNNVPGESIYAERHAYINRTTGAVQPGHQSIIDAIFRGRGIEVTPVVVCDDCGANPCDCPPCKDGHTPGAAADCVNAQVCTVCGDELAAAAGHTPGAAATCTTAQVCEVCGIVLVAELGHEFLRYVSDNNATCTADGTETAVCSFCDETHTVIAAGSMTAHTPGAAADCVNAQVCVDCGCELAAALGHDYGAGATCTEAQVCTVCGYEAAPALDHTPGEAATCTTAQVCIICDVVLVEALGHTPGAAATCTATQNCTVCGVVIANALGHFYGEYVYDDNATCSADGTETATCERCPETLTRAAAGSVLSHTPGAAATCTTAQVCTVCGVVIADSLGHFYGEYVYDNNATCSADGTETATCERCPATLTRAATGSVLPHTPGAAATCTTTQVCEVCGDELAAATGHTPGAAATCTTAQVCTVCDVVIAAATGHTPGAAATCTTNQVCVDCGIILAEATGHTPGAAATCTTPLVCAACGFRLAPALGHEFPAGCDTVCSRNGCTVKSGEKCGTCSDCRPPVTANYRVNYAIVSSWTGNANIQITITNTGTTPIRDWSLQYDFCGTPINVWNATVSGGAMKCMSYNSTIAPGASVSFGYTLSGYTGASPAAFVLTGEGVNVAPPHSCADKCACAVCDCDCADKNCHDCGVCDNCVPPHVCVNKCLCELCDCDCADKNCHDCGVCDNCVPPVVIVCGDCGKNPCECTPCDGGHTPGAAATCTTAQVCTVCNVVLVAAKNHTPGAAATCTTAQTCVDCGVVLVAAKSHTPGNAATCTTAQTCVDCGVVLVAVRPHTPGAAATCTTAQVCTVCRLTLAPALGHSFPVGCDTVCSRSGCSVKSGVKCGTCVVCNPPAVTANYRIEYVIDGSWADNQNVRIMITNTGTTAINGWTLLYDFCGTPINIWNGTVSGNGAVTAMSYNANLAPGQSATFGYTLTKVSGTPDVFVLA